MTVKELIKGIVPAIKTGAKFVVNMFANAKIETIVKIGAGLGAAAVVAFGIVKFIKMKKEAFSDESNKSTVDDALEINFTDIRKHDKLNPLMKKVKKNIRKELKPRYKKSVKKNKKSKKEKYLDFIKYFDMSFDEFKENYDEYCEEKQRNFDVLGEYDLFMEQMKEKQRIDNGYKTYHKKTRADWNLREVWENN